MTDIQILDALEAHLQAEFDSANYANLITEKDEAKMFRLIMQLMQTIRAKALDNDRVDALQNTKDVAHDNRITDLTNELLASNALNQTVQTALNAYKSAVNSKNSEQDAKLMQNEVTDAQQSDAIGVLNLEKVRLEGMIQALLNRPDTTTDLSGLEASDAQTAVIDTLQTTDIAGLKLDALSKAQEIIRLRDLLAQNTAQLQGLLSNSVSDATIGAHSTAIADLQAAQVNDNVVNSQQAGAIGSIHLKIIEKDAKDEAQDQKISQQDRLNAQQTADVTALQTKLNQSDALDAQQSDAIQVEKARINYVLLVDDAQDVAIQQGVRKDDAQDVAIQGQKQTVESLTVTVETLQTRLDKVEAQSLNALHSVVEVQGNPVRLYDPMTDSYGAYHLQYTIPTDLYVHAALVYHTKQLMNRETFNFTNFGVSFIASPVTDSTDLHIILFLKKKVM